MKEEGKATGAAICILRNRSAMRGTIRKDPSRKVFGEVYCFISMIKYAMRFPMSTIERLTITLPADMAGMVKGAVEGGDYASTSEVIREALRDWKMKREVQMHRMAQLKADIDRGMDDLTQGRLTEFDSRSMMVQGRKLSAERVRSGLPKQPK
jgi:antitoxin ParD1/3/4